MLTNAGGYDSHVASIILSKNFDAGVFTEGGSTFVNIGYAYTNSDDRRNMFNSTAGSNYDLTAAADRQNPPSSRGFYESRHNITFAATFREQFFEELDTTSRLHLRRPVRPALQPDLRRQRRVQRLGLGQQQRPALHSDRRDRSEHSSPTVESRGPSRRWPTSPARSIARTDSVGRTIRRNTCSNDWYYDLDLSFSQELPGPLQLFGVDNAVDRIKLYAMFDNFLNFLDSGWNIQRRRNFAGLQDVASISGVDAQGRYIITGAAPVIPDAAGPNAGRRVRERQFHQRLGLGVADQGRHQLRILILQS